MKNFILLSAAMSFFLLLTACGNVSTQSADEISFVMCFVTWCNDNHGFLTAILSVLTIAIAIGIPCLVAKKQNKIALFEKRFECYSKAQEMRAFLNGLKNIDRISTYEDTAQKIIKLAYTSLFNCKEEDLQKIEYIYKLN